MRAVLPRRDGEVGKELGSQGRQERQGEGDPEVMEAGTAVKDTPVSTRIDTALFNIYCPQCEYKVKVKPDGVMKTWILG